MVVILIIVGASIVIGVFLGLIGNAKASIEVKQELAHLEEVKNSRKTNASSYGVGSLYSDGEYEGMVVAVDATRRHGRFFDFSFESHKWNVKKALDNWSVCYGSSSDLELNSQSYNMEYREYRKFTIPSIEDLRTLGDSLNRFYHLRDERRDGFYNFSDIRFEDLGFLERRFLSRDLTPDAKSVYAYDIATKRVITLPISDDYLEYDDEEMTCGIILVGFF